MRPRLAHNVTKQHHLEGSMKPASQPRSASEAAHASSTNVNRRRFLLALGAGSASAATAAAPVAAKLDAAAAPAEEASRGYRETEHVRDYYASTRL
jgi:hypothetical protein